MALEGNRLAQPTAAAQDEAKRRRAWFAAAEEGEIVAMAALLEQQPKLIDATTRLQVLFSHIKGCRGLLLLLLLDETTVLTSLCCMWLGNVNSKSRA